MNEAGTILIRPSLFLWAVADWIENALQTKLFSILVIFAGVLILIYVYTK
ncbi:hypothetical protein [Staphylococcus arlettae]|nr:hypothetical protein [Staphylococcus arlettae]